MCFRPPTAQKKENKCPKCETVNPPEARNLHQLRRRAAQATAASRRIGSGGRRTAQPQCPRRRHATQSAACPTESATCAAQGSADAAQEAGRIMVFDHRLWFQFLEVV